MVQDVAGLSMPFSLVIEHAVDARAGVVVLTCTLHNRIDDQLSDVVAELVVRGPATAGSRQPLVFKLGNLPAAKSTSWQLELRLSGAC